MPPGRPRKNPDVVLFKSAEMIGWAIGGLEREIMLTRERLAGLTAQVTKLRARAGVRGTGGTAATGTAAMAEVGDATGGRKRRRRKMSPEARKRISEMMKKRWAERRRGK
jgi:hypothetical protein